MSVNRFYIVIESAEFFVSKQDGRIFWFYDVFDQYCQSS